MEKAEPACENDVTSVPDRLLNAAEQVVARDGVANLTLEAVAREAGVSKGGLLYHFPSKSALVTAIVERLATRCEASQCLCVEQDPAPGSFTRAYLQARQEPLDPQEVPFHCALLAAAGTDPQYLEPFRRRIEQWQQRLESDGIDPAVATIVRLAIDGLAFATMLGLSPPTPELRKKAVEKLLTMISENTTLKD
jgi:AcrR family transcriptional regulator